MRSKLLILTLGMFAIGTDGYIVAGLLPEIADLSDVAISTAGQLITAFALVYAVASPVLASLLGNLDRRKLLILSLGIFTLGNVLVALTTLYPVLLLGRVIAALGAAIFTPAALAITGGIVPPERRGRSIAIVTSGLTIATAIGVPIGNWLGARIGFQGVFWVVAALSLLVLITIAAVFGPVPAPPAVSLKNRLQAALGRGVPATLAVSLLIFTGAFAVYNYIAEYFNTRTDINGASLSWVLLAFGIGGAIGNFTGGMLSDRIGTRATVGISATALIVSFTTLWAAGGNTPIAIAVTVLWGISGWLLAPAQQHKLMELGGASAPLLISLNSSAMYLGMALSGVVGGLMIATVGVEQLPLVGIFAAAVTLVLVATAYGPRRAIEAPAEQGGGAGR